jgi:hypothetical protein
VRLAWLLAALWLPASVAAAADIAPAVATIAPGRLVVQTEAGQGSLPLHLSADWTRALSDATQALIFVPDESRNADAMLRIAQSVRYAGGEAARKTFLAVAQFPADADVRAYHASADLLHWSATGWIDGEPARGPAPISSFAALDAILMRLDDTTLFPALRRVVLVGHGAGAQLVQRYAVVGQAASALDRRGIMVRHVVANASSYLWFGEARPDAANAAVCPEADHWRYGLRGAPAYVQQDAAALEERYIRRDVIYLLGEADSDPAQAALDTSCAAEAQGPTRYARGMHYLFGLELRHPNLVRHRVLSVWGIGHDAGSMFVAPCGLAALFERPGCAAY